MTEIGAYEAKTHLPKLLERVQEGERFVITKHGRPVAALGPVDRPSRDDIRAAIERLRDFQGKHDLEGLTVRDMIREGRKY